MNPFRRFIRRFRKPVGIPFGQKIPTDPADHAEDFAHRYEFPLDQYYALRMQALGIPEHLFGAPDFEGDGTWKAFIAHERMEGILPKCDCVTESMRLSPTNTRKTDSARMNSR